MSISHSRPGAEVPLACSLSAGDFRARRRDVAQLAAHAVLGRSPIAQGERLVFAGDAATEHRLRRLVAAEAECCPFLTLDLRRDGDRLVLDATGPADARPIIAELFA